MELLRGRDRYGLELVDASAGTLKRGSVYVILARMEEKGFVESRQESAAGRPAALPRRIYRATQYGLQGARRVRDAARCAGPQADGGEMSFESRVIAISYRFVSSAKFELIVAPALADLEFEEAAGRRSRIGSRAAVLRAIAGGVATMFGAAPADSSS